MAEGNQNQNQWVIWTIIVGAVIITLIAFNYQGDKTEVVPLSELFPEENLEKTTQVEYEFVSKTEAPGVTESKPAEMAKTDTQAPAEMVRPAEVAQATQDKRPYYTIQALASKNKEQTEKALEKAKKEGYNEAYINTTDLKEKGTWYRIYIGKFKDKNQAVSFLPTAKKKYIDSFIRYIK